MWTPLQNTAIGVGTLLVAVGVPAPAGYSARAWPQLELWSEMLYVAVAGAAMVVLGIQVVVLKELVRRHGKVLVRHVEAVA